ncbi:MAG: trypsin-like serine protease [Oligoflexales bacterium]
MRTFLIAISAVLAVAGCKRTNKVNMRGSSKTAPAQPAKCLKIVNGEKTEDFPSVVFVHDGDGGWCTGTFVGHNVLLTATHCIDPRRKDEIYFIDTASVPKDGDLSDFDSVKAKNIFYDGNPGGDTALAMNQANELMDLAVIIFPDNSAPAASAIYPSTPPHKAAKATLVGYGLTDLPNIKNPGRAGIKRVGQNQVVYSSPTFLQEMNLDAKMSGVLAVLGNPEDGAGSPSESLASSGDSGGPLFIDNQLAGVASWVDWDIDGQDEPHSGITVYTNLNSSASKALIEQARTGGAVFAAPAANGAAQTTVGGGTLNAQAECQ